MYQIWYSTKNTYADFRYSLKFQYIIQFLKNLLFLTVIPYVRLYRVINAVCAELCHLCTLMSHVCHILKHHSDLEELPAGVLMQSIRINIKTTGSVQIRHHTVWKIIICGCELYVFVCFLDSFPTVMARTQNTTRKLVIMSDLWSLRRKTPKYSVSVCVCVYVCISVFHPLEVREPE